MNVPLVFAPLGAIFVMLLALGAGGIALVGRTFAAGVRPRSPTLWAGLVFAPVVLATLGCIALAFPNPFLACHCAQHELHHPHLCVAHPGFAEALVAPAIGVLGLWLLLAAPRLLGLARELFASARWARTARRLPIETCAGVPFRCVESGAPGAFTFGALAPFVVFDRCLWDALSEEERRAVLHHEQGHVERRDGLTLLLLRLCIALYPVPLGRALLDGWRAAAERACDDHAATMLGDTCAVAGALVAVERMQLRDATPRSAARVPALGATTGEGFEGRVMALLDGASPAPPALGNDALAVAIVATGAAALTFAWPGGWFHHAVETLLGAVIP
jgi:Zn-dependent protease with chaperone function